MSATAAVVEAAIHEVEHGFAAFALRMNAKVPVTEHGFKNATTNPEWIAKQLAAPTAGNYGIVWPVECKRRVVVFDLDNGSDGLETPWQDRLRDLIKRIGPLPLTKFTTTPSGGRHAFYGWPAEVPIPPGDELFGFTVRWPGRGYLVGPGSSIDGRTYVAGETEDIADLPAAWVDAALAERPLPRPRGVGSLIIVTGGFELPDVIPSGRRYPTVRDYIASRYNSGLSEDELWSLVRTEVAPRFHVPKSDADLRVDFDKAMSKIVERLGQPARVARMSPQDAVAAVSPIGVMNMAEIPVEAVIWLWHRYIPVGAITLFDGNPGEGKSTIVADIVARVTLGSLWPDDTPVGTPGTVLYVTKEDDASTQVRPRIEAAGGDPRKVMFVGGDLLFPRDTGRFHELLDEVRPRLTVIDPLMSYLEGRVRTISDNDIRSAIMTPLSEMVRDVGCSLVMIRHFSKQSGQAALMRGAGSLGGLAGAARAVIGLTPDPETEDGSARVFGVVKSNFEAKPPSLRASIESAPVPGFLMTVSRVSWHGESTTSVSDLMERSRDEHQDVLEAEESLREILSTASEPVPSAVVMAAMTARHHSKNAIYNARRALQVHATRSGFPGKTTWSLPDDSSRRSYPSYRDDATTETTDARARGGHPLTETTTTTGMTEDDLQSSQSSQSYQSSGSLSRASAREAEWAHTCHDYARHQAAHRRTPDGWTCDACYPEDIA